MCLSYSLVKYMYMFIHCYQSPYLQVAVAHSTGISSGPDISPCLAHVHIVPSDSAGTAINRSLPLHHQRVISDFTHAQVIGWTWRKKSKV